MKIIKRSGIEADFDPQKIVVAITKANDSIPQYRRLSVDKISEIASQVTDIAERLGRALNVEEIQDNVERLLMQAGSYEVAKAYITYRYTRALVRQANTTDKQILSLIDCQNEDIKQENSNKNPTINSVQRDYMAGEVSKDLATRILLPPEVVAAHKEGIIHFHDMDYFAQHMYNCCLVNLEDMLQNGTVISGTKIDTPHSFGTACNIATQIIAQVASSQYGGQSISLAHLAPFVDVSRQKIKAHLEEEFTKLGITVEPDKLNELIESQVREEVKRGVQTLQYQVRTTSQIATTSM